MLLQNPKALWLFKMVSGTGKKKKNKKPTYFIKSEWSTDIWLLKVTRDQTQAYNTFPLSLLCVLDFLGPSHTNHL